MSKPWIRAGAIAACLLTVVPLLIESTSFPAFGQGGPYQGRLLYLDEGAIQQLDLATGQRQLFLRPAGGSIAHLAHSPDRRRVAYAVNRLDPQFRLLASEIYVVNADGSDPRLVVQEAEAGFTLGSVTWPQDPNRLVYVKLNRLRGVERVEEVDLTTGARSLVVEGGSSPAASPAGPIVAYTSLQAGKWSLWRLDRSSGEHLQLVPGEWFEDVDYPQFSPDGQWIAFTAAGAGPSSSRRDLASVVRDRIAPAVRAHDLNDTLFDLWVVRPDGSGLRRVAQLLDLNPQIAWSPDGARIASMGWVTLQVVEMTTGQSELLNRPPGFAPLSWGD